MTAIEFFEYTEKSLKALAKAKGIKDLDKYYTLTDPQKFKQMKNMSEIEQTYMQLAFHGQNGTLISNIVKFEKNYGVIEKILYGFNPKKVLDKYTEATLLKAFADSGISSNTDKSTKRKNAIMTGYVSMLLDAAAYLNKFKSKQEIVDNLKSQGADHKAVISYFRSQIKSRFSIPLTCDFLKEFSEEFDLPKPDVHIKDTLSKYLGRNEENYYRTEKREYECINDMLTLTKDINESLKKRGKKPITVYQLDRMIWLVCANRFFLDEKNKNSKDEYLEGIV